jgi:hypothetical protein
MQYDKIKEAKRLASEFITLVREMEEAERAPRPGDYHYDSPKHRGAVRRKSMDLTRALSEMRKT